ncbi:hypothetical protein IEQ34_014035 [Dendrobium chrysotoxum]|uniref:Uncharacterized protein n=1 Tax=Dendrobium chrysotoxum TaxID=161865 RepID=A0AAV7GKF9_DENCH|nr:hypothetical protein IEQ34_014035 [Dendrobium chrysotoxum]
MEKYFSSVEIAKKERSVSFHVVNCNILIDSPFLAKRTVGARKVFDEMLASVSLPDSMEGTGTALLVT